ncbi:hypothetical protein ACVWW1_004067 [Bradyrhizobium sp. JR3.5]
MRCWRGRTLSAALIAIVVLAKAGTTANVWRGRGVMDSRSRDMNRPSLSLLVIRNVFAAGACAVGRIRDWASAIPSAPTRDSRRMPIGLAVKARSRTTVSSTILARRAKLPGTVQQIMLAGRLIDQAGRMICHCVDGRAGEVLRTLPSHLVLRSNIPVFGSPTTEFVRDAFLETSIASIRSLLHLARSLQQDCGTED